MAAELHFVVDRIHADVAVLVGDDGRAHTVPTVSLPEGAVEGAVLAVEVGRTAEPLWSTARLDRTEEKRRRTQSHEMLEELERRDAGEEGP
jgi:hypothetical protein